MPMPPFLQDLRDQIGTTPVLLPAVVMLVPDGHGQLLAMRRADNGEWSLPSGICEPGEEPAMTAVREVMEETGLRVTTEEVVGVFATEEVLYPNGDRASYVSIVFRCALQGGTLEPLDGEALELGFFALDELPPMPILRMLPRPLDVLLRTERCEFR